MFLFRRSLLTRTAPALALGICFTVASAGHAQLFHKKKKQTDLSANPLGNVKTQQPDKELYDKAMGAMKKGHYDIARLDLQTLMNTYLDSEYLMRAKLAVGETWFKEGGAASMAQAEQEFKDFITFFPNTPEAAEAQMKVGDIYFSQMDKADRDPANAEEAEAAYRQMMQQFPDSTLVPRSQQRLREVQEVLAQRQFEIGEFYATHENWAASIARLQTVADNYPLFSHSDQALITIGDAYAQQGAMVSRMNLPPKAKEELEKSYTTRAAQAWDRVVTRYSMAPHVEEAKDRLIAAGLPIPEPTRAEMAESEAEEGSRKQATLATRLVGLTQHGPSTIASARVGQPTMTDSQAILAPAIEDRTKQHFELAIKGKPIPGPAPLGPPATESAANSAEPAGAEPGAGGAEPALTITNVPDAGGENNSLGAEVVNTPGTATPDANQPIPGSTPGSTPTAAPGASGTPEENANTIKTPPSGTAVGAPSEGGSSTKTPATASPESKFGLSTPVGPNTPAPLPPVEKPAPAPDQVNDVKHSEQPQVTTGTSTGRPGKKNPKPKFNDSKESSSKHHKKKGIDKLNPF